MRGIGKIGRPHGVGLGIGPQGYKSKDHVDNAVLNSQVPQGDSEVSLDMRSVATSFRASRATAKTKSNRHPQLNNTLRGLHSDDTDGNFDVTDSMVAE